MAQASEIAIFAGRGVLPQELAQHCPSAVVVSFEGIGVDFEPKNAIHTRFERSGGLLKTLKKLGVRKICFAGQVTRPELKLRRMDFRTFKMFPKIKDALAKSDGDALQIIRQLVEAEGFEVVGAHQIAPEMLAGAGQLAAVEPKMINLERAKTVHQAMSDLDIGQALVMRGGQVWAIETLPGTKAMLEFVAQQEGEGGFLYKASKLGQDLAMDMASIGPDTIAEVKGAKLDGICLRTGQTLILQKEKTLALADEAGLFVVGI